MTLEHFQFCPLHGNLKLELLLSLHCIACTRGIEAKAGDAERVNYHDFNMKTLFFLKNNYFRTESSLEECRIVVLEIVNAQLSCCDFNDK